MLPDVFRPILQPRAAAMYRELGCESVRAPPLQSKGVENGKSAMSFLVPGGPGVQAQNAATYSLIIKQLNAQDVQLLPSLAAKLVPRYLGAQGSLLARFIGWVRYAAPGLAQFDAVVMENVARPPRGGGSADGSGNAPWKPFDMKGIRLYPHELRFAQTFGERGLSVAAAHAAAHGRALKADLAFLTAHQLVDYSFLVNVFPSGAPPRPCAQMARAADFSASPLAAATAIAEGASLLPVFYALENASVRSGAKGGAAGEGVGEGEAAGGLCGSAVVRLALIDYLREWRLTEQMEHLQKSVTRDLVAGEVKHAVVPVLPFAERLDKFFRESLLRPAPRPASPTPAALVAELRASGDALARHACVLPAQLQRLGLAVKLRRVGAGLPARLQLVSDGLRSVGASLFERTPTWLRPWVRAQTKGEFGFA